MANYKWRVTNGAFNVASNWTNLTTGTDPAVSVPGTGDTAEFGATTSGTVTANGSVASLVFDNSTASSWGLQGQVSVSGTTSIGSIVSVTSGGILTSGAINVLGPTGRTTSLSVGAGSTVRLSVASQSNSYLLNVGDAAASGGTARGPASVVVAGANALLDGGTYGGAAFGLNGGTGSLTVSGGGTAHFATTDPANVSSISIGRVGTGTVTVTGTGSSLSLAGGFYAGRASGAHGDVTVTAGGSLTETAVGTTDSVSFGVGGNINGAFATGGTGTLSITAGGTASIASPVFFGSSGGNGSLLVSDSGSQLALGNQLFVGSGTNAPNGTGSVTVGNSGTLRFTAAADTSQAFLVAGSAASTTGTVTVTGIGSLLDLNGNSASIGNTGTGSLIVSAGGTARSGTADSRSRAALSVGNATGSTGVVTVTGAGSSYDAAGYAYIGRGGAGGLVVDQGGTFTGGSAATGDGTGANAAFTVAIGDGTPALDVNGQPNTSIYYQGSGAMQVLHGSTFMSRAGLRVGYRGGTGAVLVGSSSIAAAAGAIYVGSGTDRPGGNGTITVQGGGTLRSAGPHVAGSSSIQLAPDDGTNGVVVVTGTGSLLDAGGDRISVGIKGTGTLSILAGATATAGNTLYPTPATEAGFSLGSLGGAGTAGIDGAGSVLNVSGSVTVGGSATATGGTGVLAATNSGKVLSTAMTLWSGGTVRTDSTGLIQIGPGAAAGSGIQIKAASVLTSHGGRIEANIANAGGLINDGVLTVTGAVQGPGAMSFAANSVTDIGGSIAGESIAFTGAATLKLHGLTGAASVLQARAGDVIDLVGVTNATLTGSTLSTPTGSITVSGLPTGTGLRLASDGTGGTKLTVAPLRTARSDLDADGTSDMVLQGGSTVVDWLIQSGAYQNGNVLTSGATGYTVRGTGDFNGDGTSDVVLQNGGTVVDWIMKGGLYQSGNVITSGAAGFDVVGTGDFNGDGTTDILLQSGGTVVDWLMQGGVYQSGNIITTGAAGFQVKATGDVNGDGTTDIILQGGGTVVDWIMGGGVYQSGNIITTGAAGFDVKGAGDFNGDGTADIVLQGGGTVVDWIMGGGVYQSGNIITTGAAGFDVRNTGDYNGDGTDDIALQGGGTVVDWIMGGGVYQSGHVITTGAAGFTVV